MSFRGVLLIAPNKKRAPMREKATHSVLYMEGNKKYSLEVRSEPLFCIVTRLLRKCNKKIRKMHSMLTEDQREVKNRALNKDKARIAKIRKQTESTPVEDAQ